jgi:hypothetical protein
MAGRPVPFDSRRGHQSQASCLAFFVQKQEFPKLWMWPAGRVPFDSVAVTVSHIALLHYN